MNSQKTLVTWQRIEALFVFAGTLALFAWTGTSWWFFALLFLVPDLSMLGYLAQPRTGAFIYNLAHAYAGPALLAVFGVGLATVWSAPGLFRDIAPYALVWASHIAFDRMLGYGLKSPEGFKVTHLGHIGRREAEK